MGADDSRPAAPSDAAKPALGALQQWLVARSRGEKRALLGLVDFLGLCLLLGLGIGLRYMSQGLTGTWQQLLLFAAGPLITVAAFAWLGLYKVVTRYMGARGTTRIVLGAVLSVLLWSLLVFMSGQHGVSRTVILGYGIAAVLVPWTTRKLAAMFLRSSGVEIGKVLDKPLIPVVIYGAGPAGQSLRRALADSDRDVIGYIDRQESIWGQYIGDTKVFRPDKIQRLIDREGVREVLLAIPSGQRQERRSILKELEGRPVAVRMMPGIEEIASGRIRVTDLRPVDPGDLLGRDPVPPIMQLLKRNIEGKAILVTGAGGSVGSELARQILRLEPRRLVLFDVSEAALYEIETELAERLTAMRAGGSASGCATAMPELIGVLGSVLDATLVAETLRQNRIDTIYHAAAYKHVPIVEHNPVVGLTNNTFGSAVVAEAARAAGVERMVLISTDKAVRPTNVMGASKRLSELVLQAHAAESGPTVFTMVRFGNVLGSSGSVVRRFRAQIDAGGPITVTHPDINRYFMSIPEAAELVIQAGAMAKGGEVFVLDMGDPVKILDLARVMVRLSGLEVRDEANPDGDIAITFTGLRPGEKLYEELLIGSGRGIAPTEHPRILRSHEPSLPTPELKRELEVLRAAMMARDIDAIHALLMRTVEGYTPDKRASAELANRATWTGATRTLH